MFENPGGPRPSPAPAADAHACYLVFFPFLKMGTTWSNFTISREYYQLKCIIEIVFLVLF